MGKKDLSKSKSLYNTDYIEEQIWLEQQHRRDGIIAIAALLLH